MTIVSICLPPFFKLFRVMYFLVNYVNNHGDHSSSFVMAALSAPGQHGHMVGHHGPQTTIYSADGIKQELIQIPQLSSSTSSPDSSPIPGHGGLGSGQFGHGGLGPGGHPLSGAAGLELVKWGGSSLAGA